MPNNNRADEVIAELQPLISHLSPDELITASHNDYAHHTLPFSVKADLQPAVVLIPTRSESLAKIIHFLYRSDLDFEIRGHGYRSASARDVLISLMGFNSFIYDSVEKSATVGVGLTWLEVARKMRDTDPEMSLTYARTPTVGVGGSILTGGFSWMSSEFGLISDPINFLDAEVVKYDGSIVRASTVPDLMWALRGGGGGFGVMTKVVLRAYPYPTKIWSGMILLPKNDLPHLARKIQDFVSVPQHPKVNFLTYVSSRNLLRTVLEDDQLSAIRGEMISLHVYDACGEKHGREAFHWALEMPGAIDKTSVGDMTSILEMQSKAHELRGTMANMQVLTMGIADIDEATIVRTLEWAEKVLAIDKEVHKLTMVVPEFLVFSQPVGGAAHVAWPRQSNFKHYILVISGCPPNGTEEQQELARQLIREAPRDMLRSTDYKVLPTGLDELQDAQMSYGIHWNKLLELRRRMSDAKAQVRERCLKIEQVLRDNWIGPHRAQMCSINDFKYWQPSEVEALFKLLPDIKDRKLSPHGPESRPPPKGNQRWKELAMKTAMVGAVDAFAVAVSPLALISKTARKEVLPAIVKLNYDAIGSSFFVKCPVDLLQQAARSNAAVCVNRWGQFSIRTSGYAAISHVWAETMGLEFNDEKIEQDDRGINYAHFSRIVSSIVVSSGYEWFWLDLLAVPKIRGDEEHINVLRELKTNVINSLIHVYRNADAVIILDSLTLQLSTDDLCAAAAILSCGRWLTRMWTYQEIKLARKAIIVTKTRILDYHAVVSALDARARQSKVAYEYWHEIHLKLMRLLPSDPRGVSLADVAFCCTDRNTENDIDYARSLFALLNLQWKTGWNYEDAILHIIKSRPQDAARIAHLQGLRGLPPPYSWAPRYLARLTGTIVGGYEATTNGLVGLWTTFLINRVIRHGEHTNGRKLIFHMELLNRRGEPFEMWSELPHNFSDDLGRWLDQATPTGAARLLFPRIPENLHTNTDPIIMLLVLQSDVESFGTVVGTAAMNDDDVTELDGERMPWVLG
ncbi:hypothetical protein HJFPF1_13396 [Paramyrothecium foliicola]|nr:hypothetical protein HJFPF1_13396 [Paramyrothecium foliicola]